MAGMLHSPGKNHSQRPSGNSPLKISDLPPTKCKQMRVFSVTPIKTREKLMASRVFGNREDEISSKCVTTCATQ